MKTIFTNLFLFLSVVLFAQTFEIYVSDAGRFNYPPWQILKFDGNGENPSVFIDNNLNWPQDILFLEDSDVVLISNLGSNRITRHNAETGAFISNFAMGISGPTRIKIGPDGLLYVLQWNGTGRVKRYNLDGTFVDDFTSVGVPRSIGLDWDAAGNLYVSSYSGDLVRRYDTEGADMGLFINSDLAGPTNIWFGADGDLFVADYDGTEVKRFDNTGAFKNNFAMGLRNCEGVDFFPNGNMLIGNGGTSAVKLYDPNGTFIEDIIPSGSGNLLAPNAVVLREVSITSVVDRGIIQSRIITPSLGSAFNISQSYSDRLASVKIYTLVGALVEDIQIKNTNEWDANHLIDGMYVGVIQFQNGSIKTEKIIVKN